MYLLWPALLCMFLFHSKKKKTLEGYLSDSYKYDLSSFAAAS